jgi:hypothetical protein
MTHNAQEVTGGPREHVKAGSGSVTSSGITKNYGDSALNLFS